MSGYQSHGSSHGGQKMMGRKRSAALMAVLLIVALAAPDAPDNANAEDDASCFEDRVAERVKTLSLPATVAICRTPRSWKSCTGTRAAAGSSTPNCVSCLSHSHGS